MVNDLQDDRYYQVELHGEVRRMIRTSTKKVAVPLDGGLFRETTIEMEQHYHDNTKKLVKTEEKSRTDGRLLRLVKAGEKASVQLMDANTFEVLSLVEAPESQAVSKSEPPAASPVETSTEEPAAPATDVGTGEEDDMAKAKKAAAKKTAPKAAAKAATKKTTSKKAKAPAKKAAAKAAAKAPAKKAAAKKAAAKGNGAAKKTAPASGQSGPAIDLADKALNAKELKVLTVLTNGQSTMKISELASTFKGKAKAQANSWVRNSLRRLVRAALVEQVSRGTYKATAKGKKLAAASAKK